jgi:histidinol phosphatase-like enzyme (inositol monophosphatase family)
MDDSPADAPPADRPVAAMAVPTVDQALLDEAVDLLRQAGELTLRWFRSSSLTIDRKGDGTPVTQADKAAERFLREAILERHPHDTLVGEEEETQTGTSATTWIIDPIDGTKAFTHGVGLYTNLLAINDEHGPAIGVINIPALGETVYAGRGLGCFFNGEAARVSDHTTIRSAHISTSSFANWRNDQLQRLRDAHANLRTWGDGYGYALVATGRIEAMVDAEVALWDVAPMPVILREAGGRFTNWDGTEDPAGGSGLATNGHLHDELLASLLEAPR